MFNYVIIVMTTTTNMNLKPNYRVRIVVYDDTMTGIEDPVVFTDEPIFENTEDVHAQEARTLRLFGDKKESYELEMYPDGYKDEVNEF